MAIENPVKVPSKKITSIDVPEFKGGWSLETGPRKNQITDHSDVELTSNGFLRNRKSLQTWLPDTVSDGHEIFPAIIEGTVVNFTADDGKIKWCLDEDDVWTDCGGINVVSMGPDIKVTFVRVLDRLLILNGVDKLSYIDLATKNRVEYTFVADPTTALTSTLAGGLTGSTYKIYYGYTYSSTTGETKLSNILTQNILKTRDQWDPLVDSIKLDRPAGIPTGAKSWNVYIALASNGGTIQDTDMLLIAGGLDMNTVSFTDNGTLAIDIGRGTPPAVNSTAGPRATYGVEENGRPVLYGIKDDLGNDTGEVFIGGDGEYAGDFSSAHGGFRAEPSKGTNYFPAGLIGFRTGGGNPALTLLFNNTQGVSKQATLEQQSINYGNQTFVVWGVTQQNYGAAGVSSTYALTNYKGALRLLSIDGLLSIDTLPTIQNILSTRNIDKEIAEYFRRINTSAHPEVVSTAWANKVYYLVPAYGFSKPTQILVLDLDNEGAFYTHDIPAQWIGTVSPKNSPAFVYLRQGKKVLKLFESFGTADYKGGAAETFGTRARGAMIGVSGVRNSYTTVVQAVFEVEDLIGDFTVGVTYRNRNGRLKTKQKTYVGPAYTTSSAGGWDDSAYLLDDAAPAGWDAVSLIDEAASSVEKEDVRIKLRIRDLASELQWWYETPKGYSSYTLRSVTYEGENLGVKPDLG